MKKILVALLAIAMLFSFASCDNSGKEPAKAIETIDDLTAFAAQTGSFENTKEAYIANDIEITSTVTISAEGLTLDSAEGVTVKVSAADGIAISGKNTTIKNVVFDASARTVATDIIIINTSDVSITGCSFTGPTTAENGLVVYGIKGNTNTNITVDGNTFKSLRVPFYMDSHGVTPAPTWSFKNNIVDSCLKACIELASESSFFTDNEFTNGLGTFDVEYAISYEPKATEEQAKALSEANKGCKVQYGTGTYSPENQDVDA